MDDGTLAWAGKRVFADRVTGSKETRAEPFVAQVQNDNVRLIAGDWCMDFLDECESWPAAARKDQVDAAVCEMPNCSRKGVRGNENRIDGKVMCDYCHSRLWAVGGAALNGSSQEA
jgi:hypothetical protein